MRRNESRLEHLGEDEIKVIGSRSNLFGKSNMLFEKTQKIQIIMREATG